MKENIYDNDAFFNEYKNFPRSVEGLNAAGEWHELKKMLPVFHNKTVLDIGCGFGWHCIYAANKGAKRVIGTDISEKMLSVAKERNNHESIEYLRTAMEDLDFKANSMDIVLSSLAFHYTPNFDGVCKKINGFLKLNGNFVFSVEHPIFTAFGSQEWIYDKNNNPIYWPVDHYFSESERESIFLGEKVIKYHRTLTTYLKTLLDNGFSINDIVEPKPAQHLLETVPEMKNELRRPMMLLVSATKSKNI